MSDLSYAYSDHNSEFTAGLIWQVGGVSDAPGAPGDAVPDTTDKRGGMSLRGMQQHAQEMNALIDERAREMERMRQQLKHDRWADVHVDEAAGAWAHDRIEMPTNYADAYNADPTFEYHAAPPFEPPTLSFTPPPLPQVVAELAYNPVCQSEDDLQRFVDHYHISYERNGRSSYEYVPDDNILGLVNNCIEALRECTTPQRTALYSGLAESVLSGIRPRWSFYIHHTYPHRHLFVELVDMIKFYDVGWCKISINPPPRVEAL